jgi:hypothetical protein
MGFILPSVHQVTVSAVTTRERCVMTAIDVLVH